MHRSPYNKESWTELWLNNNGSCKADKLSVTEQMQYLSDSEHATQIIDPCRVERELCRLGLHCSISMHYKQVDSEEHVNRQEYKKCRTWSASNKGKQPLTAYLRLLKAALTSPKRHTASDPACSQKSPPSSPNPSVLSSLPTHVECEAIYFSSLLPCCITKCLQRRCQAYAIFHAAAKLINAHPLLANSLLYLIVGPRNGKWRL